jgi:hypothetical protein
MSRLGAKGGGTPFVNALENKKSPEIALRLNSYEGFIPGTRAFTSFSAQIPLKASWFEGKFTANRKKVKKNLPGKGGEETREAT